MDKTLFNFSVNRDNETGWCIGRCAEFPFLSYFSVSDYGAYQGILQQVCDYVEHIECRN